MAETTAAAGELKIGGGGDSETTNSADNVGQTFENGDSVDMEAALDAEEEFHAEIGDGHKVLKLQSPSDDAIATMGAQQASEGNGGVTDAAADRAMEPETFEDMAKYNIIQVGGDDNAGRKLIFVHCSRLPSSKTYSHTRLLGYLKEILGKYVENDYSLVLFMHGLSRHNRPSWRLLVQFYKDLERKYKKNLKALYIVHPTQIVKFLWGIFRHIVSAKFSKKFTYIHFLSDLEEVVDVKKIDIPQLIKEHDERLVAQYKAKHKSAPPRVTNTDGQSKETPPTQQFGVSLETLKKNGDTEPVPKVVRETVEYLKRNGLRTEGLFRRCPNAVTVKKVQTMYNNGEPVHFADVGDVHVPALLLKAFFRELPEPIMTFDLYDEVLRVHDLQDNSDRAQACKTLIFEKLPEQNRLIFIHLFKLLREVSLHSSENQMSDSNLAIVFGPNLVWSRDASASLAAMAQINSFVATVLFNYKDIFASVLDEQSALVVGESPAAGDPLGCERMDGDGANAKELSSVEEKAVEA